MQRLRSARYLIDVLDANSAAQKRQICDPLRVKVRKVAARWHWGSSEGERREAARQLVGLARRLGWRVSDFLHECEVEGPSAWHFDD